MTISALKIGGLSISVIYAAAYAYRVNDLRLKWFKPVEFGVWFPLMNPDLLSKIDQFRDYLNMPVLISPAPGAMGRFSNKESQHFPRPYINAIDLMVPGASMQYLYDAARFIGFHGIGLYPHWKPHPGIHLDLRAGRSASNPALWSAVKTDEGQKYVAIEKAFA